MQTTHTKASFRAKVDAVQYEKVEQRLEDLDLQLALGVLTLPREKLERIERGSLATSEWLGSRGKKRHSEILTLSSSETRPRQTRPEARTSLSFCLMAGTTSSMTSPCSIEFSWSA